MALAGDMLRTFWWECMAKNKMWRVYVMLELPVKRERAEGRAFDYQVVKVGKTGRDEVAKRAAELQGARDLVEFFVSDPLTADEADRLETMAHRHLYEYHERGENFVVPSAEYAVWCVESCLQWIRNPRSPEELTEIAYASLYRRIYGVVDKEASKSPLHRSAAARKAHVTRHEGRTSNGP